MKLWLLRHAHSEPGERMDGARALSSKGHRQVKLMRQFRKDLGIKFDAVFSSDFARAVETLPVANKKAPVYQLKELRPLGTAEEAWRAIREMYWLPPDNIDDLKVLVITHDPLIQKLAASVGFYFTPNINSFPHCGMLRIDTHPLDPEKHPLRWFVTPDLVEHMYESHVVEAATQLTEHLGRASKARIVDPLINQLRRAVARRFRIQALADNSRYILPAAKASAFRQRFANLVSRAYDEGAQYVGGQLAVLQEATRAITTVAAGQHVVLHEATPRYKTFKQPPGYARTAEDLESQLDETTRERIASIESEGLAAGLTPAAIALAIRQQFRDWATDRAQTIATHEISAAFHQGGRDVAKIVDGEHGGHYVDRHWDVQDNPCELCEENSEAGWIGEDEQWPNYPDGCPGHVGCVCSESYRTVGQSEESRR